MTEEKELCDFRVGDRVSWIVDSMPHSGYIEFLATRETDLTHAFVQFDDGGAFVIELKNLVVVLSREEFREAYRRAYAKPWDDRDGLPGAIEKELLGEGGSDD